MSNSLFLTSIELLNHRRHIVTIIGCLKKGNERLDEHSYALPQKLVTFRGVHMLNYMFPYL